jgi:hypothetical protein
MQCLQMSESRPVFSIFHHCAIFAGIFVALALRFDMSRGREKIYFSSAFAGYTAGLLVTILVMNWFQAAQVFFLLKLVCKSQYSTVISQVNTTKYLQYVIV